MLKNYLRIAIRSLLHQKLYAVINIGGLSLGLASFLIIVLYVQHEFSYNRHYKNADAIYRIYQRQSGNVHLGTDYFAVTPAQLASVMKTEFPEVVSATSVRELSALISTESHDLFEKGLTADEQFFKVLSFTFQSGDSTALDDPSSIVLTQTLAAKLFGNDEAIGQSIKFRNDKLYHVTAVVEDPPLTSSMIYSFIISIHSDEGYERDIKRAGWNNNSFYTFFVLARGASPSALEAKFPALIKKFQLPDDYKNYPFKDQYFVQELSEVYFHPNINFDIGLKGNQKAVVIFSIVAFLILLLACVNYTNLAVARSIRRSREVGLRKVVGAVRSQLALQFLGESVLITLLSLLFAVGLTYMILPAFGQIMERPIELNFTSNPYLLPGLFVGALLIGIVSGSYPALIMSSILPVHVLKARSDLKISGVGLQRLLIVVQFVSSITLLIASLVIFSQLKFLQEKELGYEKKDILTFRIRDRELGKKFDQFSNAISQNPKILGTTISSHLPTNISSSTLRKATQGGSKEEGLAIYQARVDSNFLPLFNIKVLVGRNFSRNIQSDADEPCIINETAAKAFGWSPDEAIGKSLYDYTDRKSTVIGVVRDFHIHSMHLPIQPLMLNFASEWRTYISIKIQPGSEKETIQFLDKKTKEFSPYPFEYEFVEDNFNQLYKSETKLGEIFGFFTVVSVLIAALGLFGLAAFLAGQRTREIGIRKVLGASVTGILVLLCKNFLSLVIIAFVLSVPLAWYGMNTWLMDFAYRAPLTWTTFAVGGFLALTVAALAIGFQSLKAATVNPVKSLRSE